MLVVQPECHGVELIPLSTSHPVTFLWHEDEELSQSDAQLPHFSGVSTAALSQALHQGDVGPHFVHHTGILNAGAAISVGERDLQPGLQSKYHREEFRTIRVWKKNNNSKETYFIFQIFQPSNNLIHIKEVF